MKLYILFALCCVALAEDTFIINGDDITTPGKYPWQHEEYMVGTGAFPNNISVVEFDRPVTGLNIGPVPLTKKGREHAGNANCYITGWGLNEFGTMPQILQETNINVYSQARCKADWGSNINSGHVCIGDTVNKRTSCNGDSGGPLVCLVEGQYELVGTTSWGPGGCGTHLAAGYSRIGYFTDLIKSKTGV